MAKSQSYDILIVGAGPSGTCAASLLKARGFHVGVVEREVFPRFSIGESLLPQANEFLRLAGLLEDVQAFGFQRKDGAAFLNRNEFSVFDFEDKFSEGPFATFQVKRALFDKLLADQCEKKGIDISYSTTVTAIRFENDFVGTTIKNPNGDIEEIKSQFVLDASGFGRILPRLLKLDRPADFPDRKSVFGHARADVPGHFDWDKILITVDPDDNDVWLWMIPFSDRTFSIGVVGETKYFSRFEGLGLEETLKKVIKNSSKLDQLVPDIEFVNEVRTLKGYASNVSSLYGDRFALLGNAGEFLDPIFSSGLTIAMKSAVLASEQITKQLRGGTPDWEKDFSQELKVGVNTFKTFVKSWYDHDLQDVIFYPRPNARIKRQICSILAGYAWDKNNPYVAEPERLRELARICRDN